MNIFRILSSYDGTINEPNISAFLAYLFDPLGSHGLGGSFLSAFLAEAGVITHDELDSFRARIQQKNYQVSVGAEVSLSLGNEEGAKEVRTRRDVDNLIEIFEVANDWRDAKLKFVVALEVKINDASAADKRQLEDLSEGLKRKYYNLSTRETEKECPRLHLIYLIPGKRRGSQEYAKTRLAEVEKVFTDGQHKVGQSSLVFWRDLRGEPSRLNVLKIIRNLLEEEALGRTEPIYEEVRYALKSFAAFIYTDFQSDYQSEAVNERINYGRPVREYLRELWESLGETKNYDVTEIRERLAQIILRASGKNIPPGTRDAQILRCTVNNRNRVHYTPEIRDPSDEKINFFYYPDPTNTRILKKFDLTKRLFGEETKIYFLDRGVRVEVLAKDLV